MKVSKKTLLIIGTISVVLSLIIYIVCKENSNHDIIITPEEMLREQLNITLPSTAIIENYTYTDGSFYLKVLVKAEDISNIQGQVADVFGEPNEETVKIPNIDSVCNWWDAENYNIKYVYQKFESRETNWQSISIYLFVVEKNESEYFIYVAY